jgi:transporter family protein
METWLIYALLAAFFAALTTILAKIGIEKVDSNVATAIRTMVVLVFAWVMVFAVGSQGEIFYTDARTWVFLILSGLATGGSWLCFFYALKLGTVNKIVPLKKSSTILTMILAFIILSEPFSVFSAVGIILIGIGTWLMTEMKKGESADEKSKTWLIFGLLAAGFASLVAIFGAVGIADIDANLGNAIRTIAVVPMSWLMVFVTRKKRKESMLKGNSENPMSCANTAEKSAALGSFSRCGKCEWMVFGVSLNAKSWVFLVLSGLATGASWLFFYRALQIGNAAHVVPIDKLSIILTMAFARVFLGERFSWRSIAGLAVLTTGTLLAIL